MTTRDQALEAAIVRLQKADAALDEDPTTDIAYRHRENAKLWLGAAAHIADMERQEAGPQGFLQMFGGASPFAQLTTGPIESGTYGGEALPDVADAPEAEQG